MIGLAQMMQRLAWERAPWGRTGEQVPNYFTPQNCPCPFCHEYRRILRRLERGERA